MCDAIFQQLVNNCQTRSKIKSMSSAGRGWKARCTSPCWHKRILWLRKYLLDLQTSD